jgi:hypothetical protein
MSLGKPISLALTPPLLDWLAEDPSWSGQPRSWRAAQRWRAFWSGLNARQSEALGDHPLQIEDPIFIVGPWRSGTTVMHELLTAATGCATPLTWQCMNAPAFRLAARPPADVAIARPMDGLSIGALSPQEDEFALLSLGVDSAYRGFLMPHRLPALHHTLDPQHWLANPAWLKPWEAFLAGVLRTAPEPQPLILKSPNHSFRLPALLKRFPRARVVWMAREPGEVFNSNRKMWQSMFAAHGLTAALPQLLDEFLIEASRQAALVLAGCAQALPEAQFAVCTQEALQRAPRACVAELSARLALPQAGDAAGLERAIAKTGEGRVEHYGKAWPAAAEAALARLQESQHLALASHGLDAARQAG